MVSKGGEGAFGLILEPLPCMGGRAPGVDGLGHLAEGLLYLAGAAERLVQQDAHALRVAQLTYRLAERLGLPVQQCARLAQAARFHDLGKWLIAPEILDKPGPLEPWEYALVKTHTSLGAAVLSLRAGPDAGLAVGIALTHHERWDGAGYPRGIGGEEIPLEGRIVAVADVFDALLTPRPYKPAWTPGRALEEVGRQAGRQFDPEVAAALLCLAEEGRLPLLEAPSAPAEALPRGSVA